MHSYLVFTLVLALVILGAIVQTVVGFGIGAVAGPFIAIVEPDYVPALLLLTGLGLSIIVLRRTYRDTDWGALAWTMVGRLPAIGLAVLVVTITNSNILALILGLAILATVAATWWTPILKTTPARLVVGGGIAGFTGTAVGIGGPPLAILFQSRELNVVRGTLSASFCVGGTLGLSGLILADAVSLQTLRETVFYLPGLAIGYVIGDRVAKRLHGRLEMFRRLVLLVSAASGMLLIMITLGRVT